MSLLAGECIITGCELHIPAEGKALHGDLWMGLGYYIFNGVLNEKGQAAWQYIPFGEKQLNVYPHDKVLTITGGYFERRGVVVVAAACSSLNQQAVEYISHAKK